VLVPEIGLTPMLLRAARSVFGDTVSVLHSELSAGERHDQWWRIREGDARVVVGARSAVFAPVPDLGLVVVDEEHDGSYKQDESPRYHGRDVAVMRARLEGCPAVLASATPSVESHANALRGKYERLLLPRRIGPQGLPAVEIVDRREVLRAGGDPILSPALRDALAVRLARREQSLVLLNRRGYATSLLCRECGQEAMCPNCSVTLTLHQGGRSALCHYCGHEAKAPTACPSCKGAYLRLTGFGTEKVVEAIHAAIPSARIDRLDRDRARRRGVLAQTLAAFEKGEIDVLVGTQMIAKGHDFPRVTLVGVVDADVGLGIPDFRSAERTFQLLTQVAGRAGRGEARGEVILQTHMPDHYALGHACAQDYDAFFEREMEFRRTMGYPPVAALVNVIVRSTDGAAGAAEADALARALRATAAGRYRILGPAHAPLARLRNEHRFQVLLKGHRPSMREAVRAAMTARYGEQRWPGVAVDVDPLTVM
jgi:primosomal protein N' (replication factor Y)